MKAFHDDKKKKDTLLRIFHPNDRSVFEEEFGIPQELITISRELCKEFKSAECLSMFLDFINIIPVGSDLSCVFAAFAHWIFKDSRTGLLSFIEDKKTYELYVSECVYVIAGVAEGEQLDLVRRSSLLAAGDIFIQHPEVRDSSIASTAYFAIMALKEKQTSYYFLRHAMHNRLSTQILGQRSAEARILYDKLLDLVRKN